MHGSSQGRHRDQCTLHTLHESTGRLSRCRGIACTLFHIYQRMNFHDFFHALYELTFWSVDGASCYSYLQKAIPRF